MADRRRLFVALACMHAVAGLLVLASHPQAAAVGIGSATLFASLALRRLRQLRSRRRSGASPITIAVLKGPRRG